MTALKGGLYVRDLDGLVETLSYLLLMLLLVLLSGIYFYFILISWGYLTSRTFFFAKKS